MKHTEAEIIAMVDAAMVEMSKIHPPLRRSECQRLIAAALTAVQPAAQEPLGYIDRKDISRLSNYKATIWPGENEIDAVAVYLAPDAPPVPLARPTIHIKGCNFQGKNADGSDVFTYRIRPDGFREITEIRMIDWYCQGPAPDALDGDEGCLPHIQLYAIAADCKGKTVPPEVAKLCQPHAKKLDAAIAAQPAALPVPAYDVEARIGTQDEAS